MVDDAGNILNESDVDYEIKEITDEFGNKQIIKRPYVKRDKFKYDDETLSPDKRASGDHFRVEDAIEMDQFGNKKVTPRLVPDDD